MAALAAISVDLDSLPHYCRIHGLDEGMLGLSARRLVHEVAIPRFLELFSRLSVKGTFFAIGEDLSDDACAKAVRASHHEGVEIANHSFGHDYALTRLSALGIAEQVERGSRAIEDVTGVAPVGFRAPGYTLNAAVYGALSDQGYRYDSSTFPAAPYYAAKASVMGALSLLGRPSRSVLDNPLVLAAPTSPYRPDPEQPYRRGKGRVLEFPIAVSPLLRFPFIGTFAAAFPRPAVRAVYRTMRGMPFFNFELHGVDVLDERDGIPRELVRQQRDLSVPHSLKMTPLHEVFSWLSNDFEVVTLQQAAERFASEL